MSHLTLLFTDLVDSTQLNQSLGDVAMARLWAMHDSIARGLIRSHNGRELGRTDGFLALFGSARDALRFSLGYHQALSQLPGGPLARVGMHTGDVSLRDNTDEDIAAGATPFEVDGLALPVAARIMALALGGQTLLSADASQSLGGSADAQIRSIGHWRLKGVAEAVELFQLTDTQVPPADRAVVVPPDSPKAYRVVRQGDAWVTAQDLPHNLPSERGGFVGRGRFLLALAKAWDSGDRLLTLCGMGGIGKTRLAVHYGRCWLGDHPGGTWFCDLSTARGIDGLVHAVALAIGEQLDGREPVPQLGRALARLSIHAPCLVVLDNFEQVALHANSTLGCWLEIAPNARFLVTSREVLGLRGEHVLLLPPLGDDEAERLFCMRAQAACGVEDLMEGTFVAADVAALPRLIEMLDRLPLALELAAARCRLLQPAQMLERMGQRFKLLTVRGGRPDRQATMQATLDWSWDLLSAAEQAVLSQLAVFEGGFTLRDAECVIDEHVAGALWLADLVQALLEKSWLRAANPGRLSMLRTVQDYASGQLARRHETAATEARHWRHFARRSEADAGKHRGADLDNLVVACRRAAKADPVVAAQLFSIVWGVLRLTGPFSTAISLGQAITPALAGTPQARATVHRVLGAASTLLGDISAARGHLQSAIDDAEQSADWRTWGESKGLLAGLELSAGRLEFAQDLLDEVRRHADADADGLVRYTRLNTQARLHFMAARLPEAEQNYTAALLLAQQLGNSRWQAGLRGNLGMVARADGRGEEARGHWRAALASAESMGDRQWAGNTHSNLGLLLHEMGDATGAQHHLSAALAMAQVIGHVRLEAVVSCNLGLVAETNGQAATAVDLQQRAVALARQLVDPRLEGQARGYLALALASADRPKAAAVEIESALQQVGQTQDRGLVGLVLLQASLVAAAAGDRKGWQCSLAQAEAELQASANAADPEVAALHGRALAAFPSSSTL